MKDKSILILLAVGVAVAYFFSRNKTTAKPAVGTSPQQTSSTGQAPQQWNDVSGWLGYLGTVLGEKIQPQTSVPTNSTGTGAANVTKQAVNWAPIAGAAGNVLSTLISSASNWFSGNKAPGANSATGNSNSFQTINLPDYTDTSKGYYYGVDGGSSATSDPWGGSGNSWDYIS